MQDIWHALQDGAPFSFINMFVLSLVLAIIVERFFFIVTKYRVNAGEFMAQIRKLVQAGNIDRAIKLCEAAPLPLLQVVKAGLTQSNKGDDAIIAAMDERWTELSPHLEKRISTLWTLANIATLIGLLGTISGLIRSFGAVAHADAGQRSQILSAGISEAMYNTALGLGIAVLCMTFHLIIHTWAKNIKHEVELSTLKLENLLVNVNKGR